MNDSLRTPPKRPSIEARFRSWTAEFSAVDLDEQRLKDAGIVRASIKRRWGIIVAGAVLLAAVKWANLTDASGLTIAVTLIVSAVANLGVISVARAGTFTWWLIYCLAVIDILIVGAFVALIGPGGMVVGFFVATLPYAFNEGRGVGDFLALLSAAVYIGAASVHGAWVVDPPVGFTAVPATAYVEALVFLAVVTTLRRIPASLVERIRVTRNVMRRAEGGALGVRAPAAYDDELGFLERSFNRMLDEIAGTIAAVQRETDEVVILADVLSQAATGVLASSESVSITSAELAREMAAQRELAEEGRDESTKAAKEAGSLSQRADTMAADARSLAEAATHSRSSVERASDVLLAIGDEVRITAESVHELSGMSERVGSFARTISRIARQTHVLALNAAIEAAHNEEGGEGFAAVADEVRALAAEAGSSARDVTDLIGDVLSQVDAVSKAMTSGEEKVRDVGAVAQQAQGALRDLERGISKIKGLVDATATVSQTQAKRMATLADKMADVASISTGSANEADSAAAAMATQQRTIGDLRAVSGQLAELAERVRMSIARFAVVDPADDRE
jgi:methyl-accepting chemotaxis protein